MGKRKNTKRQYSTKYYTEN